MVFLKAYWQNLILINYSINPKILKPLIPNGTELDLYNNKCYISLVGFMFKDTKILGLKIPYHIHFEEINLRFYVKYKAKRGVVFIKEIVPKSLIPFIANNFYKEHYKTLKMTHSWKENDASKIISYSWKSNTKWQTISVETEKESISIQPNSDEEFITEHYYGYTKHKNETFEYEVQHPIWLHHKIKDYNVDVDFKINYGKNFAFLNNKTPTSVILAKGSEVIVKNKCSITK